MRIFRRKLSVPGVQKRDRPVPRPMAALVGRAAAPGLSPEESLREQELYV